ELTDLAREMHSAIGQENFGFADAARIKNHLTGGGIARLVFGRYPHVGVAERYPYRLPAPAHMDDPLRIRQQATKNLTGLGCKLGFESRFKDEWACGDAKVAHEGSVVKLMVGQD